MPGNICFLPRFHCSLGSRAIKQTYRINIAMYQAIRKFVFTDSHCLGDESSKSFEELFEKLDVNKDGKVDVSELKTGLAAMGFSMGKGEAQVNPV